MDDYFEIPVLYKSQDLLFTARLITVGYVHKFQVQVNDVDVFFEQDDSGDYRAMVDLSKLEEGKKIEVALLKAIAASIESILK